MDIFIPQNLDDDLFYDVVDEVDVLCENSANTLIMLGHEPNSRELLDKLFRSIHTIKGDISLAQISPLLPLLTAVEDILGMMREGVIQHNSIISDLLLTLFEQVNAFVDDCGKIGYAEYDSDMYAHATRVVSQVKSDNIQDHPALLTQTLHILEPSLAEDTESKLVTHEFDDLRVDWAQELEPDLVFFHSLMGPVEQRIDNWQGRSGRQLKLALLLNQYAGKPIDENQLRAAVYLHDVGMSLLPIALLRQSSKLSETEINRLRTHIQRGANILLEMPHWSEAQQFILEHHERVDGKGYPKGLTQENITDGAKIIAIVDAFEAMTHDRAQEIHRKRPIVHALQEITHASGSQFCPYWVGILNKVMSSIVTS